MPSRSLPNPLALILLGLSLGLLPEASVAQEPANLGNDQEVSGYLDEVRRQMVDPRRRPEDRAQMVLEAVDLLDRAAKAAATTPLRAQRWGQAVELLDEFLTANPDNPNLPAIALQAAIDRWAQGRVWLTTWEETPADTRSRQAALDAFEDAILRLRPLWSRVRETPQDPYAQNVRYRLAQTLYDRARLEPPDARGVGDFRRQALQVLQPLPEDSRLAGHAKLLQIRLFLAEKMLTDAEHALDQWKPGGPKNQPEWPSAVEVLDTRIELLLERREYDAALQAIEAAADLNQPDRDLRAIKVRAQQWINLFPGDDRRKVEQDAFQRARTLVDANHPYARPALVALAGSILQPDPPEDPSAFELLAEGHLARGDLPRAASLSLKGATLAEENGDQTLAWRLRYRAGAILFRLGDDARADAVLTPVAQAARSQAEFVPATDRARASLLQALCRGRIAEASGTSQARASLLQALKDHLNAFPDDPVSNDARIALGATLAGRGEWDAAAQTWEKVTVGSAKWLESRTRAADAAREAINVLRRNKEFQAARQRLLAARDALNTYRNETEDPNARSEIDLQRVRLELIPEVGDHAEARKLAENLTRVDLHADRRDAARRLWIAALALEGQYVDAEREVRKIFADSTAAQLLEIAERLDQAASLTSSDLTRRRLGYINRLIATDVISRADLLSPDELAEATLRLGRGQIATGDLDGARKSLAALPSDSSEMPATLLEPWANALADLGLYSQAVDAFRVLAKTYKPGTQPWIEARYGLALAYYRSGQLEAARRLVEGTMALHPDLGGGELRSRFLSLRRRISTNGS